MKRTGKTLLVAVLIAAMGVVGTASLLAGGKQEAGTKAPAATTTAGGFDWHRFEGTTIVLNFPAHLAYNKWIELIPEFEAKTGMKVEVDKMNYMRLHDKQLLELSKPSGDYDVISIVGPLWKTEYVKAGYLAPLDDYITDPTLTFPEYDYGDLIKAYVDVQGKVCLDCKGTDIYLGGGPGTNTHQYAIPASSETSIFGYRKDLFDQAGFQAPDTWDEVYKEARYFSEHVPGVYGLTMRGQAGHQAGAAWLNFADPWGAKIFDDKWNIAFTQPASIDVLRFMKDMVKWGPPGIPGFDESGNDNAFLLGQAALYFDHSRIAGLARDPNSSKVDGKVAYTITPMKKTRLSETGGFGVAIPANSKHKEAGWMFITWLTSKEVEKKLAEAGVQLTDRNSILMDPELQAKFPEYPVLVKQGKYADPNWRPVIAEYPEIETQYFGVAVNQVMTGDKTPEAAMQSVVEPIRKIMEEGGYYK